jgi:succinate dehydrogenase (ubiquinone) cytochrome b560 subunit
MKKTGRPVSPHVTIYAFPVTALSSITNRVTGIMLSFGAAGLATAELFGGSGTALSITSFLANQSWVVTTTCKFSVAFPILYHYMGAARHWMWDTYPTVLTNTDAARSSQYLFGGATALSIIMAVAI